MKYTHANTYSGQKIKGEAILSYKIDGVRTLFKQGKIVSRSGTEFPGFHYGLSPGARAKIRMYRDCEVFLGNFKDTISAVSQHKPPVGCITEDHVYPLIGCPHGVDRRLYICHVHDVVATKVLEYLDSALFQGYEGLVIRAGERLIGKDRWYRVKPTYTADVKITGWFEQHDKNKKKKGQLGGFITPYGRVTAMSEDNRKLFWDNPDQYLGRMMEVEYKELYDSGNFRYGVTFKRFRDDKSEESFDTKR